jgi:hypothetical protein
MGFVLPRINPASFAVIAWLSWAAVSGRSQDLTPRAYVITPTGTHAIILSTSYSSGQVLLDPSVPVEDSKGTVQASLLGYVQSFGFLGRSANITLVAPYARADFSATVNGTSARLSRSGLADARIRFSANLKGGGAMGLRDYVKWKERNLIGASLTVSVPTGQHDPARVINIGTNRWGFKPEIGFSHRWTHWAADWYIGAWFFTPNHKFYPGHSIKQQSPIGALEAHLGYYVKPRLWVSADANFWAGDRSRIDAVARRDEQRNSRVGATASVPVTQRGAVKVSYSQGAYVTLGNAYKTLSIGWQFSWIAKR